MSPFTLLYGAPPAMGKAIVRCRASIKAMSLDQNISFAWSNLGDALVDDKMIDAIYCANYCLL